MWGRDLPDHTELFVCVGGLVDGVVVSGLVKAPVERVLQVASGVNKKGNK